MKKILLILICLPMISFSQIWEHEILQKNPEATFYEIKEAFERYRDANPDYKGLNPYARQLDFLEKRLDVDGKYPEDKLFRQWKIEKEKYNSFNISSISNWQELGPFNIPTYYSWSSSSYNAGNGRVNTIEFDPIDTNTIWVGAASGGLWKTIDGGINWTTNSDQLPVISISAISINTNNNQEMLIATGDAIYGGYTSTIGILRSIDGGISWDTTNLKTIVHKLERNLNYPDSIFAAISKSIMLSVDGGITWDSVYTIPPTSYGSFKDIEFMPGNSNVIYAACQIGFESTVYRSIDGGASWISIDNGFIGDRGNVEIAVTNSNPTVIYSVFEYNDNYHGLYKSIDMGDNWVLQSDSPNVLSGQAWYNLSLAVDPLDEANVWVGGIQQRYSYDHGQTWNFSYNLHADQHFAKFNPLNNSLYIANDGGIYKKNTDSSFVNISANLRIMQFYKLALSATNSDKLVGGTQDNGTMMLQNGIFNHIRGADGMQCAIDKLNENKIFTCSQNGWIARCDDITMSNYSWNYINPIGGPPGEWITPYELHHMNNNVIVIGYENLYISYDSGDNWQMISDSNTNQVHRYIDEVAFAPSDEDYIYFVRNWQNDSIMVTKNGGLSWEGKLVPFSFSSITDIHVSPNDPEVIWITLNIWNSSDKVFKSIDAGDNWINISGNNLPSVPVRCIVYQDNAKEDLYIGTDLGVYHRDSTMSDWMPYMNGLPNVSVTDLEIHYGSNKIRAATYGRGMWESSLNTVPLTVNEIKKEKRIINVTDILGRKTKYKTNQPLLYIYDDGSVEKRIIVE